MTMTIVCPFPLQYFAPTPGRATGQKLASTSESHSDLIAPARHATSQLTIAQRLSPAPNTAYGLPYETFDHV